MATVIILNGISSVGKSTLAKALQSTADRDFLHVSMDGFIGMLPIGREDDHLWFPVERQQTDSGRLVCIRKGTQGEKLLAVMRAMIADMTRSGLDVVVDEVCQAAQIADYRQRLEGHRLHVVKVTASLDIVERRERERGDRMIGLAREQAGYLHDAIDYDQAVDTTAQSPGNCAKAILATFA